MINFASVDRDAICNSAAWVFSNGEMGGHAEIVLRNICWNINEMSSYLRNGFSVSLVLEGGDITGLKVKTRKRRIIPIVIRKESVFLGGKEFKIASERDASEIAAEIIRKIEAGKDA